MEPILEIDTVGSLTKRFRRSPDQLNAVFESDAELIRLPGGSETVLCITADLISEEVAAGLYTDPYQIGWMTVVSCLSDLAAVGARPLGILVAEHLPASASPEVLDALQSGIGEAAAAAGTCVLGGDTGFGDVLRTTGVALGITSDDGFLTRCGLAPGDRLFTSGPAGRGNAYAFAKLCDPLSEPQGFLPTPRTAEGRVIARHAQACIDTSDGLIPALATLMQLNDVGMAITSELGDFLHPTALRLASRQDVPPWFFCAGPHGDFELVFSVRPDAVDDLLRAAASLGWTPISLGVIELGTSLRIDLGGGREVPVDPGEITNLFARSGGDALRYLELLHNTHRRLTS